ncbi:MAG: collagen-like protein [Bacteroidales bacterium]|nr:collagen-like protein [Bacteroidales bacterium]
MKKITGIFLAIALAFLFACEGEPGLPGQDGQDGKDGDSFIGLVLERTGDFTAENEYTLYYQFPEDITVYESDVVLVYILWEQATDTNNDPIDVWRLLPQTIVLNEGVLQYNYDYTFADVQIFLEGTIDLDSLLPAEALGQTFRIVILPADFARANDLDVTDYNLLMKSLGKENYKISSTF